MIKKHVYGAGIRGNPGGRDGKQPGGWINVPASWSFSDGIAGKNSPSYRIQRPERGFGEEIVLDRTLETCCAARLLRSEPVSVCEAR